MTSQISERKNEKSPNLGTEKWGILYLHCYIISATESHLKAKLFDVLRLWFAMSMSSSESDSSILNAAVWIFLFLTEYVMSVWTVLLSLLASVAASTLLLVLLLLLAWRRAAKGASRIARRWRSCSS